MFRAYLIRNVSAPINLIVTLVVMLCAFTLSSNISVLFAAYILVFTVYNKYYKKMILRCDEYLNVFRFGLTIMVDPNSNIIYFTEFGYTKEVSKSNIVVLEYMRFDYLFAVTIRFKDGSTMNIIVDEEMFKFFEDNVCIKENKLEKLTRWCR